MSFVSTTNKIKYNNQTYTQTLLMNNDNQIDGELSLFRVFIGKQDIAKLIEEEDKSYSFKFNLEALSVLDFNNKFKGSELESLIKSGSLKIITNTEKNIPISLKEKSNKEIVFEVESMQKDERKAFKIIIDAVSITIDYNGKKYFTDITQINKEKLNDQMVRDFEISKKKPVLSFDVSTNLYEKLIPDNIKDFKTSSMPLYMLRQYVALLEANNITNDSQTLESKRMSDKLNVYKYSFTPDNKENYFAFVKDDAGTHLLFGRKIEKISNCRLYYTKNGTKKDYSLIITTDKNEDVKLDLSSLGNSQGEKFLQNFNSNIQTIDAPTGKVEKTETHWGFVAQPMDDRKPIAYEINKNGISSTIKKKENVEVKEESKSEEDKTQSKTEEIKDDDKEEDKKENKKHKFNTKFFGDMFTTLSFFSLIASALIPGLGAVMAGFAVAFIAGSAISYAVDTYEMSIARSVKKIKENDYSKFRAYDKELQNAKSNMKEAQNFMQNLVEKANEDSFVKQFVDLYNKNGIVKENINLAQRFNSATGSEPNLETLINLEKLESETDKTKKEEIKQNILSQFDEEKQLEISQKLFNQTSFLDIEQLNVQENVDNDLQKIIAEKNKEEKLELQKSFIQRYLPSLSEEKREETRKQLFDNSTGIEEFNTNLSNYISNEKLLLRNKEKNIELIEESKIDYVINIFSNRNDKECTRMLADYGEAVARRFAYGKSFSQVQFKKFIKVLPESMQKSSIEYFRQKFNKIDKSIDNLHENIEENTIKNSELDNVYAFIKAIVEADKVPFDEFDDVLDTLPEDIATSVDNVLLEGKTLKEALVKSANENNKMHNLICSILNIKSYTVDENLSFNVTNTDNESKTLKIDLNILKSSIEKLQKENNSNSTRQSLILANILGEDFIKREIKTVKKEFEKDNYSAEMDDKELIKADKKYKAQEDYLKKFQSIEKAINTQIETILKDINQTVFDESSLKTKLNNLKIELEKIESTKDIKKEIEKTISKLDKLKNNLDKENIKKTSSNIIKMLKKINKKKNKQLSKQDKNTIRKQNFTSSKNGKKIKSTIKLINQEQVQNYIQANLTNENEIENNFVEELLQEEKE